MTGIPIRDITLYTRVLGQGYPLLIMHGGPGADHTSMLPLRTCADRFTLVFYDHRCNGRSQGPDVSTMTWDNLTRDAEALRMKLGFDQWAVLGHSFGGMVALEYALRYPQSLSHLILLDTCGDIRWAQDRAPKVLAQRGYSRSTVGLAERFFNGKIAPHEMIPALMRFGGAYYHHLSLTQRARVILTGLQAKPNPEAQIFGFRCLLNDWSVMDRLDEINVPTLVMAGRHDFQFPPEHQAELAAAIKGAQLKIVEDAGHNAHFEQTDQIIQIVTRFLTDGVPGNTNGPSLARSN